MTSAMLRYDVEMRSISEAETKRQQENWADILELAERAEAVHDASGKEAARLLVISRGKYSEVLDAGRHGDQLVRRKALGLLHFWDPAAAARDLVGALASDPCPVVRHEVAYYLATLKRQETIAPLIEALLHDPDDLVRHEAAEALGDMGATTAISALRTALSDRSAIVATTAHIALAQLSR